jgi:hypothetical protein
VTPITPPLKDIDLVKTEEWGDKPPSIVRDARFNIFFANETQIRRWRSLLTFKPFLFFNYTHKFFIVEDSGSKVEVEIDVWVQNLPNKVETIRIVTDIEAEAGMLRNKLYIAFAEKNKTPPREGIQIALSNKRSPLDVFRWTFVDGPSQKIARVFFFGTPLCETLKDKTGYKEVTCDKLDAVPTYLCIHASDPAEAYCPVWPIYEFFEQLGYPTTAGSSPSSLVDLTEVATGFRRCMETRLPEIDGAKFNEHFKKSILDHCVLVDKASLFREYILSP